MNFANFLLISPSFQIESSFGFTLKEKYHLYQLVLSCIKKLSSGRDETPPCPSQGINQSFIPFLSLKKIFFIVFPSIFDAFMISIPEESSIHDILRVVVPVIFFI